MQLAAGIGLPRHHGIGFADRTGFIAGSFQGFIGDLGPQTLQRRRCRLVRVPFGFIRSPRHLLIRRGRSPAALVPLRSERRAGLRRRDRSWERRCHLTVAEPPFRSLNAHVFHRFPAPGSAAADTMRMALEGGAQRAKTTTVQNRDQSHLRIKPPSPERDRPKLNLPTLTGRQEQPSDNCDHDRDWAASDRHSIGTRRRGCQVRCKGRHPTRCMHPYRDGGRPTGPRSY